MSEGITAKIEKNFLVVRIPLEETPAPSKSGSNLVIASSHGNKETDLVVNGKKVTVGLNAYTKV